MSASSRRWFLITSTTIEAMLALLQDPPSTGILINDLEDMLLRPGMSDEDILGLKHALDEMRREVEK